MDKKLTRERNSKITEERSFNVSGKNLTGTVFGQVTETGSAEITEAVEKALKFFSDPVQADQIQFPLKNVHRTWTF